MHRSSYVSSSECVRACVCARMRALASPCFVPRCDNAFPLKGICHPLLSRAALLAVTVTSIEWKGSGYFLFRCRQFPLHAWRTPPERTYTRTHPHTIDRFIIACQESAGFTFQQKWTHLAGELLPTPHHHHHHHRSHPANTPQPHFFLYPAHPAGVPARSAESGTAPNTCFCHKLRVSFFFLLLLFYTSGRNGERTGHSDSLNHSVWILNVLRP